MWVADGLGGGVDVPAPETRPPGVYQGFYAAGLVLVDSVRRKRVFGGSWHHLRRDCRISGKVLPV